VEEELARKAALAQKSGEAVLILPFSETGFRRLSQAIAAETPRFNEMGLELVDLASLSAPDTVAAAGNGVGQSAGEGADAKTRPPAEVKPPTVKPVPAKPPTAAVKPAKGTKTPGAAVKASKSAKPAGGSKPAIPAKATSGKAVPSKAPKSPAKAPRG
jgi:hypothetical protein